MFRSLTIRLLVPLLFTIAVVLVGYGMLTYRASRAQWTQLTKEAAHRTSDLILRATHYGMLLNQKEDVHQTIRQLAEDWSVELIRQRSGEAIDVAVKNGLPAPTSPKTPPAPSRACSQSCSAPPSTMAPRDCVCAIPWVTPRRTACAT